MSRTTRTPLRPRFVRHLERSGLLADVERPLVALSGGVDSVCLLHLLRFTPGLDHFELRAAHFDHAMRDGSAADADWVRGLCRAWAVPLELDRAGSAPRSEAEARARRYAFLRRAAEQTGADAILTAHHADDQAETLLFRLARGTGPAGLAGIRARRGRVVRPLLPFTRTEVLAYARACRIHWRDDPTNRSERYVRNRIRLVLLPLLETVRPGATRRLARLADHAAEAESAWSAVTRSALARALIGRSDSEFVLARERLLAYHPHIRGRVLRHLLNELGSRPGSAGTRAAVEFISSGASGGAIELPGGVRLVRDFDRLRVLLLDGQAPGGSALVIGSAEAGSGSFVAGGQSYQAQWAPEPRGAGVGLTAAFDLSSLVFPLELRGWRPGDRIRLGYGSKKLKKLWQERRVGRRDRARVPVLADAAGRVLWAAGLARSNDALPQREQPVFTLTVTDGEPD
jgi:tRNA(Ile)-lysidine synthase